MAVWVRRERCYMCNKAVTWDDEKKELVCGCGVFPVRFVNLREFKRVEEVVVLGGR